MKKMMTWAFFLISQILFPQQPFTGNPETCVQLFSTHAGDYFFGARLKRLLSGVKTDSAKKYAEELPEEILLILKDRQGNEYYSKFILEEKKGRLSATDPEKKILPGKYKIIGTSFNKVYGKKIIVK